jgi:acyl carrier protein
MSHNNLSDRTDNSADKDQSVASAAEKQVRLRVERIVVELAPNPDGEHSEIGRLAEEFGYHSLALLELAFTLEDEFDLPPLDEKTARAILTISDVVNHVIKELRASGELS